MSEFESILMSKETKNLDMIPFHVADILFEKHLKIAVAESITGGTICSELIKVPGATRFFAGGVVAYNNILKVSECLVDPKTINRYGAVSSQVCLEMAKGIRHRFQASLGVATTGFAGPQQEQEKVGLVFIGISLPHEDIIKHFEFTGQRMDIISQTAFTALELLRYYLSKT